MRRPTDKINSSTRRGEGADDDDGDDEGSKLRPNPSSDSQPSMEHSFRAGAILALKSDSNCQSDSDFI